MGRRALSIQQPWATLVVYGRKRIEVRRWSTAWTGEVYIHCGQRADRRDTGWDLVTDEMHACAQHRGGLVGKAVLTGCRVYRSLREFRRDHRLHWNSAAWFRPPVMYGFELADGQPIPFEPRPGRLRFFDVSAVGPLPISRRADGRNHPTRFAAWWSAGPPR